MAEMLAGGRGERGTVGPVLRYPGSKWGLAKRIVGMMPEHQRYIEPFAGSAAMLLAKPRSDVEIINDLDDELVNLYSVLRDRMKRAQLIEYVELTPYAEAEMRAVCSASPTEDAVERARRYLVRSWLDIAGLRPHSTPCFRLPGEKQSNIRPARVWSRLPERIARVGIRLKDVEIRSIDAVRFIASQNSPNTLVYADPPYLHETRASKRYYNHEMSDADHLRLIEALLTHTGPVLLSGYDSALYRDALAGRGWRRYEFLGRQQNRRPGSPAKREIVWANPEAVESSSDERVPLFDLQAIT
ncbi:MAG: DNA adenine methylase [Actinomycetota bacterium]|nr:DNA adenine methylase [Actinomycetota bacterium]